MNCWLIFIYLFFGYWKRDALKSSTVVHNLFILLDWLPSLHMYLSSHANCIKIRKAVFFIFIIHFMFPLHRFNIASGWSSLLRYDSELFPEIWNTTSVFHCVVIVLSLWQLSQRSMHTYTFLTTLYCSIPFSFIIMIEFSKLSFF